jgi:hypothetical protein
MGVEDFELLQMMKKKDASKTADLIRQVFRDYTDYSTDVSVYRAARRALLEGMD